jgi:hypothetical protein
MLFNVFVTFCIFGLNFMGVQAFVYRISFESTGLDKRQEVFLSNWAH